MWNEVTLAGIGLVASSAISLRVFYGDGEEEAKERMNHPYLGPEIELEKSFNRNVEYIYRNDVRLYMQTWIPKDTPKGVVLLLHGMNGHSGRATPFFNVLLRAGYVAVAFDLHGFGRSSGCHGYVPSISSLADDAVDILKRLKERFPDKPIFLLGGSMGGLTAVHAALKIQDHSEHLINGLILHAPALHIHSDARPPWIVEMIGRVLFLLAPKLPLLASVEPPASADGTPLNVPEEPDALFYNGRLRLGTGLAIVGGIEAVASKLQNINFPFLVQHGEADSIVDADASRHLMAVASSTDKTLTLYPKGGHLLWAEPESICEPFMRDMIAWLDARV